MKEKCLVLKRSVSILFTKNFVLQIEQGDLFKQTKFKHLHLKTARVSMLGRLMIDQGDLGKHINAVQDDPEVYHEAEKFNTDKETIRERIEEVMDFKIPGLPHSVKHAQNASVQELIQKIENHPNQHVLQQVLRQNQSFVLFSPESTRMIREVGNIELCELLETEPKAQCKVCYHIGTLASSIARAGTSCLKEERKIRNSISPRWTFFLFPTTSSGKDNWECLFGHLEKGWFLSVYVGDKNWLERN